MEQWFPELSKCLATVLQHSGTGDYRRGLSKGAPLRHCPFDSIYATVCV